MVVAVVADDEAADRALDSTGDPEICEEASLLAEAAQVGGGDLVRAEVAAGQHGVEDDLVGEGLGDAVMERRNAAKRGVQEDEPGEGERNDRDQDREDDLLGAGALEALGGDEEREDQAVDGARCEQIADQQKACDQRNHGSGPFAFDAIAIALRVGVDGLAIPIELTAEALLVGIAEVVE